MYYGFVSKWGHMEFNQRDFRVIIIYDIRQKATKQQCVYWIKSAFTEEVHFKAGM